MYFTRDDFFKIKKWLCANGIKDSEMVPVTQILNDDSVAIVQRGNNKKLSLSNLLKYFLDKIKARHVDITPINGYKATNLQDALFEIYNNLPNIIVRTGNNNSSLDIADEYGNVLVSFINGGIKTQQFDSFNITTSSSTSIDGTQGKYYIEVLPLNGDENVLIFK